MLLIMFLRFLLPSSLGWISFTFAQKCPYPTTGYPYIKRQYSVQQIPSPIALNTNDARVVYSVPPCEIHISEGSQLQLRNSVYGVTASSLRVGDIILKKGPVFDEDYIFNALTYRNDGVPHNTRCGITENGKGTAVAHSFNFYKKSYGSPQNALKYADGFVLIFIQATNSAPNRHFESYERALYEVRQPNATTVVDAKPAIYWLLEALAKCSHYFAWPGTIAGDPEKNGGIVGKQYPAAAVTIQIPLKCSPIISCTQFFVYPSILNRYGESTTNVLGLHPTNGRPIVKCTNGFKLYSFLKGH